MAAPVLTPNAWLRWDLIRRQLGGVPGGSRILELGMGGGALGARLSRRGRYTGIEPDDRSRGLAARRVAASARVLTDLSAVAPTERFDVVCAFEVLEHIEDDHGALCSWVERIEPGGMAWLSVPAHPSRFSTADEMVGHVRRYSREQLAELISGSGLEVSRIDSVGFPVGNLLEWGRNRIAARRLSQRVSLEERTAASGRFLQPPDWVAPVIGAVMLPCRLLQRPFRRTELGPGWVAIARRPAP